VAGSPTVERVGEGDPERQCAGAGRFGELRAYAALADLPAPTDPIGGSGRAETLIDFAIRKSGGSGGMKNLLAIDRRLAVLAAIAVAVTLIVLAMVVSGGAVAHDQAASMVEYAL
jgi:hypothetical protein